MPEEASLPMPGGPLPSRDILIPYNGGEVRLSPQAQQSSRASQEFATAFPNYEAAVKKGANSLDSESQLNLDELRRQMRSSPPKPATILNLHPWKLQLPGNRFAGTIVVPECIPGSSYAFQHIRGWVPDKKYNENGSFVFTPVLPIHRAAEFMREFSQQDVYGPGLLIYEGEANPDKLKEVELYDIAGRPMMRQVQGYDLDPEENKIPVMLNVAIKRDFVSLLESTRDARNAYYMHRVRIADQNYKQHKADGKGRMPDEKDRKMAEVLFAEGLIAAVPEWNLATRLEEGLAAKNCPACARPYAVGAYKCGCGNILDAFAAYMDYEIDYQHGKMGMLSDEQRELATAEEERRQVIRQLAPGVQKDRTKKEAKADK